MIPKEIVDEVRTHAAETDGRESCGVIVLRKGKQYYRRCRNIAERNIDFEIHPDDYTEAEDFGEVQYIVHSHHYQSPEPSQTDLIFIERTQKPWLIVNHPLGHYTITEPSGYVTPLEGRQFVHGVTDCLSIIQDYYKQELGITLKDYKRPNEWWMQDGYDFYDEFHTECGFHKIQFDQAKTGDVIVMKLGSKKNNHAAIYLGDSKILHHCTNRLSCKDIYGGYWMNITSYVLRHKDVK